MMPWPGLKGPKGLPNAGGPREWGQGIIPGEGDNMDRVWGHVIPAAMKDLHRNVGQQNEVGLVFCAGLGLTASDKNKVT